MAVPYKHSADRMKMLQRLPEQVLASSPGLSVGLRAPSQAEYHRPTELVHTLVQRHYYPAEGAVLDGVGEPVAVQEGGGNTEADRRVSEYQRFVRQRAAQTSAVIRAENDENLQLAAGDRIQAGKDYGVRVAVGNAKVLLRSATKSQAAVSTGAGAALKGPSGDKGKGKDLPVTPPPPKELTVPDQIKLEREHHKPRPATIKPGPSVVARHRLLAHCPSAAAELAGREIPVRKGAVLQAQDMNAEPQPRGYKTRVLQVVDNTNTAKPASPTGKLYKGRPLPLAVSVNDEFGLARIAQKAAELGAKLVLPRLCSCVNPSSVFDRKYVTHCARNCPLYQQPARYEALLTGLLRAADVI
ncbi:hypothetical protein TSOC_008932 [Tetrabaena socialis]|uniref:Uncharacterized protein n=1 Tax=Tetrabaena socialis TaxID=47790 RepID=A0A2J7ZX25_9CHLO|nr:hypothetical protein TSOC_008932 [Tetrabaena socialis]|eukprot:PNH04805.1 hypothetical protein TSOC_008932 [Tetrabaena socialis]